MTTSRILLPLAALAFVTACNAPDPDDYGGGAEGAAIAKCITRTERADSSVTREQAGDMCTCLTGKVAAAAKSALSSGRVNRAAMERSAIRCARDAGIEITG